MEEITSNNGIKLLKCEPLNWVINHTYADGTGPLFYSISVGDMEEMWSCTFYPEKEVLYISNMAYSSNCVVSFKVSSFEDASKMVKSFADAQEHDFEGTIYVLKESVKEE